MQEKLSTEYGTIETPFRYGLIRLGYTLTEDPDPVIDHKYSIDYAYIHTKNKVTSIHFGGAIRLGMGDQFGLGLLIDENLDCEPWEIQLWKWQPGFMERKFKTFGTQRTNNFSYKLLI